MDALSSSEILGSTQLEQVCKGDFCGYDAQGFISTSMDLIDSSLDEENKGGFCKTPKSKENRGDNGCSSKF
eukprot:8127194-Ditylum_brightwellii.AAC.1